MKLLCSMAAAFLLAMASGRAPQATAAFGKGRVETFELASRVFKNTRNIRVYLPPGYGPNPAERYPVLYLNDGFAVFSERAWNAPSSLDSLIAGRAIPPMIVVGIDNAASIDGAREPVKDRTREFLPYTDRTEPELTAPRGLDYPAFVVDEVMPQIARRYRVRPGPEGSGIGGSSYGGIAALVTVIARPGVFGKLLLESTPLFLFDERLTEGARAASVLPASVHIAVGSRETDEVAVATAGRAAHERFVAMLLARAVRVQYTVVEGGTHDSRAWGARLPAALTFLYPPGSDPRYSPPRHPRGLTPGDPRPGV